MSNLEKEISHLRQQNEKAQKELELIETLRLRFPDLEIDRDRWGRARYMAASANALVNQVEFHYNCGCCEDSPLHARPYMELPEGIRIYSNPCGEWIGERKMFGGFLGYTKWRRIYEEAGVNAGIIEKIQEHIDSLSEEEEENQDECNTD